ncbi:MAG: HupE/UreJ family protein, partial [Xanthomonadales bacterium]|nr:HupE/UreJ family protein [Xanthomonadales bacterium]
GQWVETGILGSVILVGALVALGRSLPAAYGLGLAALFAVFHGLAHGAEMGAGLSAPLFAAGFLLSSTALVGLGLLAGRLGQNVLRSPMLVRAGGAAILATGLVMAWVV